MDEYKNAHFDPHSPEKYLEMFPDSDLVERVLETVPEFRIDFGNCENTRTAVQIKGLHFDMSEEQHMQRFGRFKGQLLPWGHHAIVGIRFIYQEQSRMYTNRAVEALPVGDREVWVFFGKVFIAQRRALCGLVPGAV